MARSNRPITGRVGLLYAVMTGFVLYPVLSVEVPALCDYLNHLARMHILANIDNSEALRSLYRVHWQMIPYLAMDASFAVLDHFATIYNAGRVFVAMCVVLPVVSVAALHYAVHRRVSFVPVTAFLFCYNYLLSWGFLNYLPALCLAALLFAGWIGSTEWSRWPRAAMFCVLATVLYLSHLVAFGAYCLSVSTYQLSRVWRTGFRPPRKIAADWLAAGFQALPAGAGGLALRTGGRSGGGLRTTMAARHVRHGCPSAAAGGHTAGRRDQHDRTHGT
jgi:hypothetical protein